MNLMDLLKDAGGGDGLGAVADRLNLGSRETGALVDAVAPALMRSLNRQTATPGGLQDLTRALGTGNHDRYIDRPELLKTEEAVRDGNGILGHLFGSKDVSRNVAANAAESTGIDPSLIKKALPLLAGLAMGALNKKTSAGKEGGSILGGLLGGGDGDFGVDDVLNLARKFF